MVCTEPELRLHPLGTSGGHVKQSCHIVVCPLTSHLADTLSVRGSEAFAEPASVEYVIHVIHLSQEDRQNLRINSDHTPEPIVHPNSRLSFKLSPDHIIRSV